MPLTRAHSLALFALAASLLLAVETWLARSLAVARQPDVVALAVTADVALGLPLLYYALLARRKHLPGSGMVLVFIGALAALRFVVLPPHASPLVLIEALVPLLEVALLAVLAWRLRAIADYVRAARATQLYFSDALRVGLHRALGPSLFTTVLTTELSLLYFALVGWLLRPPTPTAGRRAFSYHRDTGYIALFALALVVIPLETLALHLVVQRWSVAVAWVLTALSVYSLVWLVGYYQATRLQPHVLDATHLHLRAGFQWRAQIPLGSVAEVRRAAAADARAEGYLSVAVFGAPRLVIRLQAPVAVTDLFGRVRSARVIGVTVDDEVGFLAALSAVLGPRPADS